LEEKLFKINGENYEIEQAYIEGQLDEEENVLIFGLEISAKAVNDYTQPLITSETLLKIRKGEIKRWQDIAGKVVEWGKPSKNIWKPHIKFINLYKKQIRGNFIYSTKVEFKKNDSKIFIKINGLCDSKFNGNEIKTLSLDIETEVEFKWVQMGPQETEEITRDKLKKYLDTENFKYSVSKLELSNSVMDMGRFDIIKKGNE
jgi:hypothetical protein